MAASASDPALRHETAQALTDQRVLIVVNAEWYFLLQWADVARALRRAGAHVVVMSAEERGRVHRITDDGFTHLPLPLHRRSRNPLHDLRAFLALVRTYRALRPTVVHHATIKPVIYGTLAARLVGIPAIVNTVPGLGYMFSDRGAFAGLRRALAIGLYRAALGSRRVRVTFQNQSDLELFVRTGIVEPSQTALIRGAGVDATRFVVRPEPDGPPVVVFASRLLWEKGVGEFVDMATRLRARGVDARFVLVGTPDTMNPGHVPATTVESWVAQGHVEWWGHRDDMPDVLAGSHVVVLPTRYPEGLPTILVEAAACARAIVTTGLPGCRDLVIDDVTGVLVSAGDVEELARVVASLLADPARRARLGAAARAHVEARFALPHIIRDTLAQYVRALAPSQAS